jgi:hypothetical protein
MFFDENELNPGTWFYFPEDQTQGVCLRVCAGDDMQTIRQATFKTVKERVVNPKTNRLERIEFQEEIDPTGQTFKEMYWDFIIMDFKVKNKEGEWWKVSRENKVLLMGRSTIFSKFVTDSLLILTGEESSREEIETKN